MDGQSQSEGPALELHVLQDIELGPDEPTHQTAAIALGPKHLH